MTTELIVTDLQKQEPGSGLVYLYEMEIATDTWIYFTNEFSDDAGTTKVQFRNRTTTANTQSYNVIPTIFEGLEYKFEGPLPRPTITIANVLRTLTDNSLEGSIYLGNNNVALSYDDLLGLRFIRRTTLKKYLYGESGDADPPVEFPIDLFYMDRIVEETNAIVTFELVSPFDLLGITLPRRIVVSNGCSWRYQEAGLHLFEYEKIGACKWQQESKYVLDGTEYIVYVNQDDEYVVPASLLTTIDPGDASTRTADSYYYTTKTALTQIEDDGVRTTGVSDKDYWQVINDSTSAPSDGDSDWARVRSYVVYDATVDIDVFTDDVYNSYRTYSSTETVKEISSITFDTSTDVNISTDVISETAHGYNTGDLITYSDGGGTAPTGLTDVTDYYIIEDSANGVQLATNRTNAFAGTQIDITAIGAGAAHTLTLQVTRLWKAKYRTQDASSHVISPEFSTYWERGDLCGKRLESCGKRFGFNPISSGTVTTTSKAIKDDIVVKPFGGFPTSRTFA